MKAKLITVWIGVDRALEFEAHDFALMPTGHLSVIHEDGVMKMDGTPQRQVVAIFAPGAWSHVMPTDAEEKSKIAV